MLKLKTKTWNTTNIREDNLIKKINYLYGNKYYKGIKALIVNTPIQLLVSALEKIDNLDAIDLFLIASQNIKIGQLFCSFNLNNQIKIIEKIKPIILSKLLADLNADDVVELLEALNSSLYKKVILSSSQQLRKEIKKIKYFEHGQAGSIMNTTIITLFENMKVKHALDYLRKKKNEFDIEQEIFVLNQKQQVVGQVKIQNLFFCEQQNKLISEFMDKSFAEIMANEDIDEVINLFQKYSFANIAVLNEQKQILGTITNSDLIPEILEENMDDIYKFYGITNTSSSYLKSSVFEIVKSRIFWLIILLFATTFTTFIIDKFESLGFALTSGISSAILVPMIPVITDMCGNSGSQTTATMIQAFACNEIQKSDFWKVIKKEFQIALVIGIILSVFNFFRLIIYFSIFPISTDKISLSSNNSKAALSLYNSEFLNDFISVFNNQTFTIKNKSFLLGVIAAGISSISLFLVILISKLTGVFIPYAAIKLNYDPAAFSTPILTTILDAISTFIFFGLGILIIYYSLELISLKVNFSNDLFKFKNDNKFSYLTF